MGTTDPGSLCNNEIAGLTNAVTLNKASALDEKDVNNQNYTMKLESTYMRSNNPRWDFDLVRHRHRFEVDADGFKLENSYFKFKKLKKGFPDYKLCLAFMDKYITHWQCPDENYKRSCTSADLLKQTEAYYGKEIMHGALLLALEIKGRLVERQPGERYAMLRLSAANRKSIAAAKGRSRKATCSEA